MADKFLQEEVKLDATVKKLAFQTLDKSGFFELPEEPVELSVEEMIEMYQTDGKIAKIIDMPLKVALEDIVDYTNTEPKYVEYVHEYILSSPRYKQWLSNIMTSRWIGVSVSVVNLKRIENFLVVDDIFTVDPTIYYDGGIGTNYILCDTAQGQVKLPRKNCIVHTNDALWGNPYGTSILKYIKKAYNDKLEIQAGWKKFLRRFGLPITIGRLPLDASPEEFEAMVTGLEGLAYGAYHVVKGAVNKDGTPNSVIEFVETAKTTADFKDFIKELDKNIITSLGGSSILFNTEENGSYSLGAIHLKIFLMTVNTIRNQIQELFCGKIVAPMLKANFGPDVTSFGSLVFKKYEGREFKEVAQGYAALVSSGILQPGEPHIRKDLAQPLPSGSYNYNDADVGQVNQQTGTQTQQTKGGTNGETGTNNDSKEQSKPDDEKAANS